MSSLTICIIACIARLAPAGSEPPRYLTTAVRPNLPHAPVTILQPAATFDRPAIGGQSVPQAIDLGLIGAVDLERDRMGIFEPLAAVECHEALARQHELHHQ